MIHMPQIEIENFSFSFFSLFMNNSAICLWKQHYVLVPSVFPGKVDILGNNYNSWSTMMFCYNGCWSVWMMIFCEVTKKDKGNITKN